MSRMCVAVVVMIACLSFASVAVAQEYGGQGYTSGNDPFGQIPTPSGMRFVSPISVQTGSGGGVPGGPPCATCGNGVGCVYWSLLPWYGLWDEPHHGQGCGRRCGAGVCR